MLKRV